MKLMITFNGTDRVKAMKGTPGEKRELKLEDIAGVILKNGGSWENLYTDSVVPDVVLSVEEGQVSLQCLLDQMRNSLG